MWQGHWLDRPRCGRYRLGNRGSRNSYRERTDLKERWNKKLSQAGRSHQAPDGISTARGAVT